MLTSTHLSSVSMPRMSVDLLSCLACKSCNPFLDYSYSSSSHLNRKDPPKTRNPADPGERERTSQKSQGFPFFWPAYALESFAIEPGNCANVIELTISKCTTSIHCCSTAARSGQSIFASLPSQVTTATRPTNPSPSASSSGSPSPPN